MIIDWLLILILTNSANVRLYHFEGPKAQELCELNRRSILERETGPVGDRLYPDRFVRVVCQPIHKGRGA